MSVELIEAVSVVRDGNGWWGHPGLPDFGEDVAAYHEWLLAQGLEVRSVSLWFDWEGDGEHPYWAGEAHCRGWEPSLPRGDGWWCLCIGDTEEGPVCWWVRRREA